MMGWLRRLLGCRHESTYWERRDVGNTKGVMHLVCQDCGYARPVRSTST